MVAAALVPRPFLAADEAASRPSSRTIIGASPEAITSKAVPATPAACRQPRHRRRVRAAVCGQGQPGDRHSAHACAGGVHACVGVVGYCCSGGSKLLPASLSTLRTTCCVCNSRAAPSAAGGQGAGRHQGRVDAAGCDQPPVGGAVGGRGAEAGAAHRREAAWVPCRRRCAPPFGLVWLRAERVREGWQRDPQPPDTASRGWTTAPRPSAVSRSTGSDHQSTIAQSPEAQPLTITASLLPNSSCGQLLINNAGVYSRRVGFSDVTHGALPAAAVGGRGERACGAAAVDSVGAGAGAQGSAEMWRLLRGGPLVCAAVTVWQAGTSKPPSSRLHASEPHAAPTYLARPPTFQPWPPPLPARLQTTCLRPSPPTPSAR